jgi:hypothetical protein
LSKQEQPKPQDKPTTTGKITEAQGKRLFAILSASTIPADQLKEKILADYKVSSSKDLTIPQYNEICKFLEDNKR